MGEKSQAEAKNQRNCVQLIKSMIRCAARWDGTNTYISIVESVRPLNRAIQPAPTRNKRRPCRRYSISPKINDKQYTIKRDATTNCQRNRERVRSPTSRLLAIMRPSILSCGPSCSHYGLPELASSRRRRESLPWSPWNRRSCRAVPDCRHRLLQCDSSQPCTTAKTTL